MPFGLPPISPVHVVFPNPEPVFYLQWDFWLGVGTLLLAGITAWLAFETRKMRQGSDKAMTILARHAHEAAESSRRSADAAEKQTQHIDNALTVAARSAKAAEDMAAASKIMAVQGQRAWITISDIDTNNTRQGPLNTLLAIGVTLTFRNGGPTPATKVSITNYLECFREIPETLDVALMEGSNSVLGPGITVELEVPPERANTAQVNEILKDTVKLCSYGVIVYRDIFGECHETCYCLVYDPSVAKFVYYDKHNSIT